MLNLLKVDGNLTLLGAPERPHAISAFPLLLGRRSLSGSPIGGIAETQETLDFCAQHNITADVEMIPIQKVNEAWEQRRQGVCQAARRSTVSDPASRWPPTANSSTLSSGSSLEAFGVAPKTEGRPTAVPVSDGQFHRSRGRLQGYIDGKDGSLPDLRMGMDGTARLFHEALHDR